MYRGTGRTWRPVFGTLAGSGLVFRVAADANWMHIVDLLGRAADSTALTGLLTVLATSSPLLGGASLLSQLLLYFVFIYAFVPRLFPEDFGEWRADPKFRIITTVTVFVTYLSFAVEIPVSGTTVEFGTPITAGLAYFAFFERRQADPFEDPDGAIYRVLNTAIGTEDEELTTENDLTSGTEGFTMHREAEGVRPLVARALAAFAACGLLVMFAIFLGVLAYVVSLFFPIPELLILGWSGYTALANRIPRLPDLERSVDIEAHVYETISVGFVAPVKGLTTVLFLVFGFFTSALPFLGFMGVVSALSLSEIGKLLANATRGGPVFVMLFGLLAFGLYGLWYWWRTSRRIPAFLTSVAGEERDTSVTRPVWLTWPPTTLLMTGTVTSLTGALYLHAHPSLDLWPVWFTVAAGVAYLPGLALMAVAVVRTCETEPQSPETENQSLPMAAIIQVVGVVLAAFSVLNYEAVKRNGLPAYADGLSTILALTVLGGLSLLVLFYFPDIQDRADEASGLGAMALESGPAFAFAILSGGLLVVRGNPLMALAAVGFFVSGGCFLIYLNRPE